MVMRKSKLSKEKQERLMENFVSGSTARCASELIGVNKSTAAYFFHRLREIILRATEDETPLAGEIEVDESYFGGVRKGKRSAWSSRRQGSGVWPFKAWRQGLREGDTRH